MRFVDTNVLLYAISTDHGERSKAARANEILDQGDIGLSVQVLQEFYVQATRASRADAISHDQATGLIESWCRFPVQVDHPRGDACRAGASAALRHLLLGRRHP